MVPDYVGCWFIENILFANLEPRTLITKGRERKDQRPLEAKKASQYSYRMNFDTRTQ